MPFASTLVYFYVAALLLVLLVWRTASVAVRAGFVAAMILMAPAVLRVITP